MRRRRWILAATCLLLALLWGLNRWPPRARYYAFSLTVPECRLDIRSRHRLGAYRVELRMTGGAGCDPVEMNLHFAGLATGDDGFVIAHVPLAQMTSDVAYGEVPLTWWQWYRIKRLRISFGDTRRR